MKPKSNYATEQIQQIVHDRLMSVPVPYPPNVTNLVFLGIYEDPDQLRRYNELRSENRYINSRIGSEVARQTGLSQIGRTRRDKCPLIKSSYALLGYRE